MSKPRRVYLVSCSGPKLTTDGTPVRARDLYTSPLFEKAFTYASERADQNNVFILSARLGLLAPDALVESYDFTLSDYTKAGRKDWGDSCFAQLLHLFGAKAITLVILAGDDYAAPFRKLARVHGWTVREPLAGMKIGRRLSWLNGELNRKVRDPEAVSASGEDVDGECGNCGQNDILVADVGQCGPCTFGEAKTAGGNF